MTSKPQSDKPLLPYTRELAQADKQLVSVIHQLLRAKKKAKKWYARGFTKRLREKIKDVIRDAVRIRYKINGWHSQLQGLLTQMRAVLDCGGALAFATHMETALTRMNNDATRAQGELENKIKRLEKKYGHRDMHPKKYLWEVLMPNAMAQTAQFSEADMEQLADEVLGFLLTIDLNVLKDLNRALKHPARTLLK